MIKQAVAAVGLIVAIASGCRSRPPTGPGVGSPPVPSPSPHGAANGTILENLPQIRALEAASGRSTVLVALSGVARPDGTVLSGSSWSYRFATLENNILALVRWSVWSDGRIEFAGPQPDLLRPPIDVTEIGQAIQLDSPALVILAKEAGATPYYTRYPDAQTLMTIRYLAREPVAEIQLRSLTAPCELGPIDIHAGTGALMARDLRCLDRLALLAE